MSRGLPPKAAHVRCVYSRPITRRHATTPVRGTLKAVSGARAPAVVDYRSKARSTGPSHLSQRISFRQDVSGLASIFPPGLGCALSALSPCSFSLSLSLSHVLHCLSP